MRFPLNRLKKKACPMTFTYYTQSKLVFGPGAQNNLEQLLREQNATSILLVYSGDYVFDLGIHDVVER